jgi:hypothetical protein
MADEPTPIRRKRVDGRSKRVKLAAVMAAEMSGVVQASKQTGIPATTIEYWLHKPEFAEFRTKTREDLVEEVKTVAHLAWARVAETMPKMHPRDAMFAAEKASTILQLLQGQATGRIEHRDLTDSLDDHERDLLAQVLRDVVETADAHD